MPSQPHAPDVLPVLARGRHRNPRKGACFMELASFLAGEPWSDHPACTHPLLASLARQVNDLTSDAGRDRLAPLIPSVIGLTTDDRRVDVSIALRCAATALPVVAEERQRALAVSVLVSERVLASLEGRSRGGPRDLGRDALAAAPHAERWAREFTRGHDPSVADYCRHAAPTAVRLSTSGVAEACTPDPEGLLRAMLVGAIEDTARLVPPRPEPTSPPSDWAAVRAAARAGRG